MKYYSEKLDKLFSSPEAVEEAEAKAEAEAKEKAAKAQERKTEANEVERCFKEQNAAVKLYNEEFAKARNVYNQAVRDARKAFEDRVTTITAAKEEARKAYDRAFNDFVNKHPEGYRLTLRDGDNVLTLSGGAANDRLLEDYMSAMKVHEDFVEGITNLLYR